MHKAASGFAGSFFEAAKAAAVQIAIKEREQVEFAKRRRLEELRRNHFCAGEPHYGHNEEVRFAHRAVHKAQEKSVKRFGNGRLGLPCDFAKREGDEVAFVFSCGFARAVSSAARGALASRSCVAFGVVYEDQLLEPTRSAFLSCGFIDSYGFPFHALALRARRA